MIWVYIIFIANIISYTVCENTDDDGHMSNNVIAGLTVLSILSLLIILYFCMCSYFYPKYIKKYINLCGVCSLNNVRGNTSSETANMVDTQENNGLIDV